MLMQAVQRVLRDDLELSINSLSAATFSFIELFFDQGGAHDPSLQRKAKLSRIGLAQKGRGAPHR